MKAWKRISSAFAFKRVSASLLYYIKYSYEYTILLHVISDACNIRIPALITTSPFVYIHRFQQD